MSYELQKPLTDKQRADFIVEHNHRHGLKIEDTDMYLFALFPNEIMGEKEIEIDVPDYDEEGNPVMVEIEETITIIDYDEDGNETGSHEETITKEVQSTHKETITIPYPIINPNYEKEQEEKERQRINKLTCTKRVFALMLQELGITYSQLKTLIATSEQAQLEWDLCVELQRENPLLNIFGPQLGITPEQIDLLFRAANGEIPVEQLRATNDKESEEE